jgi:hypothetical protein
LSAALLALLDLLDLLDLLVLLALRALRAWLANVAGARSLLAFLFFALLLAFRGGGVRERDTHVLLPAQRQRARVSTTALLPLIIFSLLGVRERDTHVLVRAQRQRACVSTTQQLTYKAINRLPIKIFVSWHECWCGARLAWRIHVSSALRI